MAHVRFHAMRMDFQRLIQIMVNPDFTGLIFQPFIENVDTKKDAFLLLCYEVYNNNPAPTLSTIPFIISNKKVFDAKNKVMFGNLPFKRSAIQTLITATPTAPYLYFLPTDFGDYSSYVLTTDPDNPITALTSYDLKPSPPAIPPTL